MNTPGVLAFALLRSTAVDTGPGPRFVRPELLVYLLALIPFALLFALHFKQRFPVVKAFIAGAAGEETRERLSERAARLRLRYILSSFFFLCFMAALIFALAGPLMGSRLVREFRRGSDAVLAFDISRSMLVRDSSPVPSAGGAIASTRLERALYLARALIAASEPSQTGPSRQGGAKLPGVRFAVAIGKGRGALAVPLTEDTESVSSVLDALSSDMMSSRGTNLENLIGAAESAFLDNAPAGRQIILFSDGDDLSGSFAHAVERAKLKDVSVCAVGLGSISGAPVPAAPGESALIRSSLHADSLRGAVERCAGVYIDGNRADAPRLIAEAVIPSASSSSWVFREEAASYWHIFVILGIAFLCASLSFRLKRRPAQPVT
jgi:Ca-activated chloride channel family protein